MKSSASTLGDFVSLQRGTTCKCRPRHPHTLLHRLLGSGLCEQFAESSLAFIDIIVGDELVTSGLGCVFPAGYPAGKVIDVTINPSLPFAHIAVAPSALLDRHRQVLLVWPDRHRMGGTTGCDAIINMEHEK